jgi:hypothetical protein
MENLTEDIKKLHKLDKETSKTVYKSKEFYQLHNKLYAEKKEFIKKYGQDSLVKFVTYKTLKNRLAVLVGTKTAPKLHKTKFSKFD